MNAYSHGELVNVTIKGARVQFGAVQATGELTVEYGTELGTADLTLALDSAAVTIERAANGLEIQMSERLEEWRLDETAPWRCPSEGGGTL